MQEQQDARVAEAIVYFIVQWLSIFDYAATAEHKDGGDHVLLHSSVVEHLMWRNSTALGRRKLWLGS